jgi:hypothetical protein
VEEDIINDTREYHRKEIDSLGWEVTVCNMLELNNSIIQNILRKQGTFGNLLLDHIAKNYSRHSIKRVLEVGGGYGYIMRDILMRFPVKKAVMLDISSYLIQKQKKTLEEFEVEFIEKDFFDTDNGFLSGFDVVILNENIGDFETVAGLAKNVLGNDAFNRIRENAMDLIEKYKLKSEMDGKIFLNTGAVRAVEKLCCAGIGFIYISEQSCESKAPGELEDVLELTPSAAPERIKLKGHDEYTIRFSDLIAVAEKFNYTVERGSFADFINPELNDKLINVLKSPVTSDKNEIIQHFIHDLFKYEYLILTL